MLIRVFLTAALLFVCTATFAQNPSSKKTVKKVIQLNTELEFKELTKLFDSALRKQVSPFMLNYIWNGLRDKYGSYKGSVTKNTYTKNNKDFVIEELQFDSGFIQLKIGINPQSSLISSYMLIKEQTREMYELERRYKLPSYANKRETEAISVEFGQKPFILKGELTLPNNLKRKQKVPAVVLVHGSGLGDMNAMNGPQQPFKDIAYGLAAQKIAVLRYDKRTLTYGEECAKDTALTVNKETVDDAIEAVKFLRQQKNIDPEKIYVLGHSLGGMMLPRIGQTDSSLAGLIYVAAPARSLADEIIDQMDYLSTVYPDKEKQYQRSKEEFVRHKTKWYDSTTPARYLPFNTPASYWIDLDNYNQTQEAIKITQPMLFLQGDADYQVPVGDYKIWQNTLKDNPRVTFKIFKSLTHNMIFCTSKLSTPDDYKTVDNVHEGVIKAIAEWVNASK